MRDAVVIECTFDTESVGVSLVSWACVMRIVCAVGNEKARFGLSMM
jgi:hypothetical protein